MPLEGAETPDAQELSSPTLPGPLPLLLAQQALNNAAILKLVKAGLSDDLIVTTINAQPETYDTSPNTLIALKAAGISGKVVTATVAKAAPPQHLPRVNPLTRHSAGNALAKTLT